MIHALIQGRLKEPAKRRLEPAKWLLDPPRYSDETFATMIANDATNRARVIELVTNDGDTGRALRGLKEGDAFGVTGEASIAKDGTMRVRVRTVQTLKLHDDSTPAASRLSTNFRSRILVPRTASTLESVRAT